MLRKILDKFQIINHEDWANVRCTCCDGFLSSGRNHVYYEWACIPTETDTPCEYRGSKPHCYTNNPNCPLRKDKEVIAKREYFYKFMRSEIIQIFQRYGVCIIDKQNEEVLKSLELLMDDFTIYGFRDKGKMSKMYKEGDEIVQKVEEVDTILLVLYPNIPYRLLEAKIKIMNTDKEVLRNYLKIIDKI